MNPYQQPGGGYPAPGGYPPQGQPGGYPAYPAPGQPGVAPGGYQAPAAGYGGGGYQPQQAQYGSPNKQFIQGGLTPGRIINITLTPGPSKFVINLRHSDGGDIAFHFNPRMPEQVVVRNTCVNGGWQGEERQQPSFPFRAGQQCSIMILCEQSQFKVAVNGQHFLEYRLRTPSLQMIQLAEVDGDFTLGSFYIQ